MSAPLYHRYKRYADREAKRFPKKSVMRTLIPWWKKPNTRVYSLSQRASYETGYWSTQDPAELIRAMSLHYLPTSGVWVEFDFDTYQRGANRVPYDDDRTPLVYTGDGVRTLGRDEMPLRVGVLIFDPSDKKGSGGEKEGKLLAALIFYLYGNGTSFVGPAFAVWSIDGEAIITENKVDTSYPLAPSYADRWSNKHPRLFKKLSGMVYLGKVGTDAAPNGTSSLTSEVYGTTRMAIAALTAALAAKQADYDPNLERTPKSAHKARSEGAENKRVIEVDLFIRERPKKPGGSIKASLGHMEGVKKGLHTVGAHWAYRARKDGSDPTKCPYAPYHDFEAIEGTKTQICVFCQQKRWFKAAHERGDEQYGIVPLKTYNVRAGALPAYINSGGDQT